MAGALPEASPSGPWERSSPDLSRGHGDELPTLRDQRSWHQGLGLDGVQGTSERKEQGFAQVFGEAGQMGGPVIETGSRGERAGLWGRFWMFCGGGKDRGALALRLRRPAGPIHWVPPTPRPLRPATVQPPSPSEGVPLSCYARSKRSPGGLRSLPAAHGHLTASRPGSALWGLRRPRPFALVVSRAQGSR